jgi:predicted RNA-binding protein with PUA-like domain
MATWLLKTEPETYAFETLQSEGKTNWDGVRNALAQRHLKAIRPGDRCYIYHSGQVRAVVGVAEAAGEPVPDTSDPAGKHAMVPLVPVRALSHPLPLADFKAAGWVNFDLVRLPRLSVMPVPADVEAWIEAPR